MCNSLHGPAHVIRGVRSEQKQAAKGKGHLGRMRSPGAHVEAMWTWSARDKNYNNRNLNDENNYNSSTIVRQSWPARFRLRCCSVFWDTQNTFTWQRDAGCLFYVTKCQCSGAVSVLHTIQNQNCLCISVRVLVPLLICWCRLWFCLLFNKLI